MRLIFQYYSNCHISLCDSLSWPYRDVPHVNTVIINYINYRFCVLVNQVMIYKWFNGQKTLKLPLAYIYLAVHDSNWLTQVLLLENVSCFFVFYPISQVVSRTVWDSIWIRPFGLLFSLPNNKEKKAVWPHETTCAMWMLNPCCWLPQSLML